MSFRFTLGVVAMAFVTLVPALAHAQAEANIGVVSVERVIAESQLGRRNRQELESESQKATAELAKLNEEAHRLQDDLSRNELTLSDAEKMRRQRELRALGERFEQRKSEYAEDFEQHRSQLVTAMLERIQQTVEKIAREQNFDVVVAKVVAVSDRVDITARVIQAMDASESGK